MHLGAPQVGGEEHDPLAHLGQGDGQVGGDGGLAVLAGGAGHHDRLEALALGHDHHPGAQRPVGLGGRAVRVLHGDQRGRGAPVAAGAGHRGQHGGPQVLLEVDPTPEPVVDPVPAEGHQQPEEEAEEGAEDGVGLEPGLAGASGRLAALATVPASLTLSLAMSARVVR